MEVNFVLVSMGDDVTRSRSIASQSCSRGRCTNCSEVQLHRVLPQQITLLYTLLERVQHDQVSDVILGTPL